MASFVKSLADPLGLDKPCHCIYLQCTPLEQALRWTDRELGAASLTVVRNALLEDHNQHHNQQQQGRGGVGGEGSSSSRSSSSSSSSSSRSSSAVGGGRYATIGDVTARLREVEFEGKDVIVSRLMDNEARDDADRSRFAMLYGEDLDYRDASFYDLTINTSDIEQGEKFARAMASIQAAAVLTS